ncbi:MAG TPA: flagellar basal-body rod protein FlgF [Beijerinckiaceae bacterium]|jgi:flagellar basal-body rod protein FlgF
MQSGLYVGVSGQVAMKQRLDTLATNVANMSTPGYRSEEIRFESLLAAAGQTQVNFVSTGDTFVSRRAGPLQKTGGPLEVAVAGDAWMAFDTPEGRAYTRDGRLQMGPNGVLTTLAGQSILDAGGGPLTLDPQGPSPSITRDGMISQGDRQVGAIGLFRLDENARIVRIDGSAVMSDAPAQPVLDFTKNGVAQGFLEGSNVNPILEMARLIAVQRLFESMSSTVETQEATMTDAIKTLGSSTG